MLQEQKVPTIELSAARQHILSRALTIEAGFPGPCFVS